MSNARHDLLTYSLTICRLKCHCQYNPQIRHCCWDCSTSRQWNYPLTTMEIKRLRLRTFPFAVYEKRSLGTTSTTSTQMVNRKFAKSNKRRCPGGPSRLSLKGYTTLGARIHGRAAASPSSSSSDKRRDLCASRPSGTK